jgi:outer membrane protein assembly factor BamA
VDARIATSGTRGVNVYWDVPGRWRDWRFLLWTGAERLRRAPYFGLGNDAEVNDSLEDANGDIPYYRYELLRTTLYGVVQRRLSDHFRIHAAAQFRHYRATPLDSNTALGADIEAGIVDTGLATNTEVRLGLLYDSRDWEATPSRGLFVETIAATSVSGEDYQRLLVSAREFFPLDEYERWILAFRQTAELANGAVPYYVAYERTTTWYPEDGFGGPTSIRLYDSGRYLATDRTVFSADLRFKYIDIPYPMSPVRLWFLAFGDVGRLWNPDQTPDLTGLHWAAGVGSRLQIAKGTLFGIDLGMNDDQGFAFTIGTSFGF